MNKHIGQWAFNIGVVLALALGIVPQASATIYLWIMAGLGLAVGLLNITSKESAGFLVSSAVLILIGESDVIASLSPAVGKVLASLVAFVAPAALIVALRTIHKLAAD